jgi:hypothetical protein
MNRRIYNGSLSFGSRSDQLMPSLSRAGRGLVAALAPAALAAAALALAFNASAAPTTHPNLSGFWEPRMGSMKPVERPSLTPRAIELGKPLPAGDPRAALANNGIDETDSNCLPPAQPWILTQSAPIDIAQAEGETMMFYEGRSIPWHIYTDGRAHPDMATYKRTLNGHSAGHWEGEEFVVDTVGFADHPGHGPFNDLPHNPTLHVTQRFHLEAGGQELHARFTIDDPKLFTKPYVYDFTWFKDPADTYAAAEVCDARNPANSHY